MPNTVVQLKRSGTAAAVPSTLSLGELAINYTDGKVFYALANGTVVSLATGGGGNYFGTVSINGGTSLLVADTTGDVLTMNAGNNIVITGDSVNDAITISANAPVKISDTAPTNPEDGSLWWASNVGKLFVRYSDSNSSQWVETTSAYGTTDYMMNTVNAAFNTANLAYLRANQSANIVGTLSQQIFFNNAGNANGANGLTFNPTTNTFTTNTTIVTGNVSIGTTSSGARLSVVDNNTSLITVTGEIAEFAHTVNSYAQVHIRNASNEAGASGDLVLTADTGTDTTNFIDIGINGSGYSQPTWNVSGPRDGYVYVQSQNLSIGAANTGKSINFFIGGTMGQFERMRLANGLAIGTFTDPGHGSITIAQNTIVNKIVANGTIGTTNKVLQSNGNTTIWGVAITVGTTAPSSPSVNDIWIDTN